MPASKAAPRSRTPPAGRRAGKRPIEIHTIVRRLRKAITGFADAAMFELADAGYASAFEQLVACIISIRTRDEVMVVAARRLFERARTPAAMAALPAVEIDALIRTSSFHEAKARQIRAIARRVVDEHGGTLPCDRDVMLSFHGVGPKCTNLVMGIACGEARIGVDVHVHRVTNRWGYVRTASPAQTTAALEAKLPRRYWVEINRLLVPFGKHVCTGQRPKCSTCPVLEMCRQVGVTEHR